MNRRTLKKHCARARQILIEKHKMTEKAFICSDGQESIDAPTGMERRFVRNGWLEPGPLKGTWLYYPGRDYWGEDSDCELPTRLLHECEHWAKVSDEEMARMLAEPAVEGAPE